jgi:hypothetical protein
MFTNFIYFIIVILIYSTYHYPGSADDGSLYEALFIFPFLLAAFVSFTYISFRRLEKSIPVHNRFALNNKFDSLLNTCSILAILLFAVNVYGINLPSHTRDIPLFKSVPAVEALFFICLFLLYLSIIWAFAFGAYKKIYYADDLSRRSYVINNISLSIPVVTPCCFFPLPQTLSIFFPLKARNGFLQQPKESFCFLSLF